MESIMPQPDKLFENRLATGIVIGIGVALLIPVAVTALAPVVRPLARSALRAGALAYEKAREGVAEFGEMAQDIVAEVEEELRVDKESAAVEPNTEDPAEPE